MSYVYCPVCDEGEIEVNVYQDSDGDTGVLFHSFTAVDIEGECPNGCELTAKDRQTIVDKAAEDAANYQGDY